MSIVISLLLFALAIAAALLTFAAIQTRLRMLRNWVRLDNAVVVESRVDLRGQWALPVIVYEYHSDDIYYVGQDSPWLFPPLTRALAERWSARYQPGNTLTVFVNPDDHQVSKLFVTPPIWLCIIGMLCVIAPASSGAFAMLQ